MDLRVGQPNFICVTRSHKTAIVCAQPSSEIDDDEAVLTKRWLLCAQPNNKLEQQYRFNPPACAGDSDLAAGILAGQVQVWENSDGYRNIQR